MYFYRTLDKVVGKHFTYIKSQQAEAVGKPLLEFHSLEVGGEIINITSQNQLILLLNQHDIQYSRINIRNSMILTLIGEGNRTVSFSFDGLDPCKYQVSVVHFNKFKAYVRAAIDESKKKIRQKCELELKNENSVLDRVLSLVN